MIASGHGGSVEFDGNFVTITRKGFGRIVIGKGNKRIPVTSIAAVQLKPAGVIVNGFIQFTIAGGVERRSRFGKQTSDAARDENSVVFTRKRQPAFEQLRSEIEAAMVRRMASPASAVAAPSLADQLTQLTQLRAAGALSEEEFQAAKARLLQP